MLRKISSLFTLLVLLGSCKKEQQENSEDHIVAIENGLLKSIQVEGEAPATFNIEERMKVHNVPGASIAVIIDGKLQWAKGYGIANTNTNKKVDINTLFQAGSISKPVAALAALKLVDEGKLDLDEDVSTYLKSWKIPDSKFTETEKVTLRRLLTHTAGMTVHGFPGYTQKDSFPSINTVLNGKGNTAAILLDTIPGSLWRYSGGGYTIMEKIVEDVSGLSLEDYMSKNILPQMDMTNSTYSQPLEESMNSNVSAAYYGDGEIIEGLWHNYPEQAAAGLWTTPSDLAKYLIEIHNIYVNDSDGVLSKDMVTKMLTKDMNDWGLGPSLRWDNDSLIFGHGGKNAGFTNDMMAFAKSGNGVIVMTSADNGGRLIGEVLRSISKYYNWGTHNTREVAVIKIPQDELEKFAGKYQLDFQVPDIGDYNIDVTIRDGKIHVIDPNNNDENLFTPQEETKFIDLDKGDRIEVKTDDSGNISFLWNGQYNFNKINE
ncbi:serine hydrolase domain-containing protein [Pontimicrobium sp. SW4]|uniref:Serine hydrolase domain-containing protein n=1 Tax=Pontimicrobium sp. SW4 TaxID=3153519 RepID=A0AAU7BU42_9FLAO